MPVDLLFFGSRTYSTGLPCFKGTAPIDGAKPRNFHGETWEDAHPGNSTDAASRLSPLSRNFADEGRAAVVQSFRMRTPKIDFRFHAFNTTNKQIPTIGVLSGEIGGCR